MRLGLGIDTGGTYTDSVIMDIDQGKVIRKAKALTTREDLAIGIRNSLEMLLHKDQQRICLVSMSSTLATNSVVEGKGCRVGLILIGMEQRETMPVDHYVEVAGGHTLNGLVQQQLDIAKVEEFVGRVADHVDAFAVSSFLSIRNPEHELKVRDLIRNRCPLPIVCGHELSSQLGFYERTITAVLNAKLIPIIADLIVAVKNVLEGYGITAPLMVVKGDGSLMSEQMAVQLPVETVLSGPAASIVGARFLTREQQGVIIDIGGTTTDIGILRDGKPRLDPEGALIGGWRTRVKAVDVMTSGIGGDSRIVVAPDGFTLSPLRVVPLCVAARKYPVIAEKLRTKALDVPRQRIRYYDRNIVPQLVEFFVFSKDVKGVELSSMDMAFIETIKKGPCTIFEIAELTGLDPYTYHLRHLEEWGMVARIGLTPTDILHAMGSYVEFDKEASELGVLIQAKVMNMTPSEFCSKARQATIDKVAHEVLVKLVQEDSGLAPDCALSRRFLDQIVSGKMGADFSMALNLNKKIIGIGAPVSAYLPEVADKFHTQLLLPEHSEVGNAVGAITSTVVETVEVLIKPKAGMSNTDNPPCIVFSSHGRNEFSTMDQAKTFAIEIARKEAMELAEFAGADGIELVTDVRDDYGKIGNSYGGGGMILGSTVSVMAVGKPRMH
jgi:N-methylhydantoinase A/oxoprolinase/acetone carboxylase beta subunit